MRTAFGALFAFCLLFSAQVAAQGGAPSGPPVEGASPNQAPNEDAPLTPIGSRDLTVWLAVATEAVSNGHDPWRSLTLDFSGTTGNGRTLYGAVRETSRFSMRDHQFMAGLSQRVSPRLIAVTELEASPTHQVLARWMVLGRLHADLRDGWNLQTTFRHSGYDAASVNMGIITAERYWGRYRGAYTLYISRLGGSGASGSHRVHGDYYYGRYESSLGASLSYGSELENIESLGVVRSTVRSAALVGRQWLNPRWVVVYDAVGHQQGSYYTRRRLGISLGHRF